MSTRVAVLGAGFAGFTVARSLISGDDDIQVVAVNRTNYILFTPMLPEVASGEIEPRHIAQPIRTALPEVEFVLGEVKGVDFENRSVSTCHPFTGKTTNVQYDQIVIALGAESSTHHIPGAAQYTVPLKTLQDAVNVRAALIRSLEAASASESAEERRSLLTVAIVGGGFTGVEAGGEVLSYLHAALEQYRNLNERDLHVVLIAGTDKLLEQLPEQFGTQANEMLAARGIEIVFRDDVASIDEGGVTLHSGKRFDCKTVIWSAGVGVPELVEHLDLPRTEHGAIAVNADMSVSGRPGVWALGDCAAVPKPGGGTYPQTAQHAVREAEVLAGNIKASLRGGATSPCTYHTLGMMASLGHREGLADIGGFMISGGLAWALWRAYYFSRLPGAQRKTRVALDWALSLPFPSDIANIV